MIHKAKDDIKEMMHFTWSPLRHHRESHGMNDEIDINTPLSEVKAPNMFERVKEEIDAVLEAISQKNDLKSSPKGENRVRRSIKKVLAKVRSPRKRRE